MSDSITVEELSKGINDIGWDILTMLSKKEYMVYADFIKNLDLCRQKCCLEIARLEGALLINSKCDPKNRREIIFSISNLGIKALTFKP